MTLLNARFEINALSTHLMSERVLTTTRSLRGRLGGAEEEAKVLIYYYVPANNLEKEE